MLTVETIGRIRREHFLKRKTQEDRPRPEGVAEHDPQGATLRGDII
jgi:hypothetical protein